MAEAQLLATLRLGHRISREEVQFPENNLFLRDIDGPPQWEACWRPPVQETAHAEPSAAQTWEVPALYPPGRNGHEQAGSYEKHRVRTRPTGGEATTDQGECVHADRQ
jgi:hypothetical protein